MEKYKLEAEKIIESYINSNYGKVGDSKTYEILFRAIKVFNDNLVLFKVEIKDDETRQWIINTMLYFAAMSLLNAKDENIAMVKAIKDEDIKGSIEPYLQNEKDAFFVRVGAMWMRDEILKRL